MNFSELSKKAEFNTLSSESVWDNAGGNASILENKTSVWIVCNEVTLRICNIAVREIDGIDDLSVCFFVIHQALSSIVSPQGIKLYMSELLASQVKPMLYGIPVEADKTIKNNEKPVH